MNGENGAGNVQVTKGKPNSAYGITFCAFPTDSGPLGNTDCTAVSPNFMTDAGGNATVNFQFSRSGTWSGVFEIFTNSVDNYESGFDMPANGTEYQSPLKVCKNTSSTFYVCGTDQLTSGYLTVNGTTVHVSLRGAPAATTFTLSHCDNNSKNPCSVIGSFATDSNGNTDSDLDYEKALGTSAPPGPFIISRDEGSGIRTEFVSAFMVP